jgi:hypothetical protein
MGLLVGRPFWVHFWPTSSVSSIHQRVWQPFPWAGTNLHSLTISFPFCRIFIDFIIACFRWNVNHMVMEILSVTLASSLTRVARWKEIFRICVARWYACGLLRFTWRSGLWGSLVYFKSTRRYMRHGSYASPVWILFIQFHHFIMYFLCVDSMLF